MRKFIFAVAFVATVLFTTDCAAQRLRNDVLINYDQLSADASYKQFKKASKANQLENLNLLMNRANEEYYKCKSIEDVYKLRDQLELIKFYNNNAKQKSIAITNAIIVLDRKIVDVEATYKEKAVVNVGSSEFYSGRGQEL